MKETLKLPFLMISLLILLSNDLQLIICYKQDFQVHLILHIQLTLKNNQINFLIQIKIIMINFLFYEFIFSILILIKLNHLRIKKLILDLLYLYLVLTHRLAYEYLSLILANYDIDLFHLHL